MNLLLSSKVELAADAHEVISEITHPALAAQLPLAISAIYAWTGGLAHAAQALAVAIIETAAFNHLAGDFKSPDRTVGWDRAAINLDGPGGLLTLAELRVAVAVAPLAKFYTHWFPNRGTPMPTQLSRHAASHQAHIDHFTEGNALLAVLLMASILRATDELLHAAESAVEAETHEDQPTAD